MSESIFDEKTLSLFLVMVVVLGILFIVQLIYIEIPSMCKNVPAKTGADQWAKGYLCGEGQP